ncbi:MAG TPA: GlsB/YeaQ/YmgE family stress response membrane protein [Polyangiaceae bacterium]|nr:GlsB/YeaQ/YmgE family stress response membrane protein [Polyangiaceae bacterium]
MSLETLLIMLIVGLIAGWLAGRVVGEGYGLVGDMVVGVVGAFIGAWLFRTLGIRVPLGGLLATIFVAFIGAIVLLLLIRLFRRLKAA